MSVLYLLSANSSARKDGGRILIEKGGAKIGSIPARTLDCLIVNEDSQITTSALFYLMEHDIPIFFIDWSGKIKGRLTKDATSIRQLFQQLEYFQDEKKRLSLVQEVVVEKIGNQQRILQQYASSQKNAKLEDAARTLKTYASKTSHLSDEEQLRGMEGIASRCYFSAFSLLFDQQKWKWKGRSQHPAKDPVNALLNYGYAFLEREVRIGLMAVSLDARIGFFHANNGRKDSLVYDLMEFFRQPVIDRFVLSLLNRKTLKPKHFSDGKDGIHLSEEARFLWCARYEAYMEKIYRDYGGKTSRQMIHERIRQFNEHLRDNKQGRE